VLRQHKEKTEIAEALRSRDNHTEFLNLVARMNTDMSEDERFTFRSKLAQEFRRLIDEMVGDKAGITIRLKPAPHQKIEFRFEGHEIKSMTIWSREAIHPDFPKNPMRALIRWPRESLFGDSDSDLIGLFGQFTAIAALGYPT